MGVVTAATMVYGCSLMVVMNCGTHHDRVLSCAWSIRLYVDTDGLCVFHC